MDDTLCFFVNKHIYPVDSYWCIVGFLNSPLRQKGVNTSITLDAAKWNCDGAELSSSIPLFYWTVYYNIRNTFETNLPVDFYPFVLCTYMFMFLMYCDLHA